MTRILAVGYASDQFLPAAPSVPAFPEAITRDDLERLSDLVAEDLAEERAVVAIYPTWWAEPSLRRLETIRSVFDSARIVLYGSSLPPLAGGVLCALAAAVAPSISAPGLFLAGLPVLERQVLPVARMTRIGDLAHPAPTVWQHLASWWPGTAFGVSWWPRPSVRRLRRADPAVPLPPPVAWSGVPLSRLAVANASEATTPWVRDLVAAPLDVVDVVGCEPPPLGPRFWGSSGVLEAAAYPTDVATLTSWVVGGQSPSRCRWCGERVVSPECPFCRIDRAAVLVGEHRQ
jgi:hypothetical protein